jgi:hypothetical protein
MTKGEWKHQDWLNHQALGILLVIGSLTCS